MENRFEIFKIEPLRGKDIKQEGKRAKEQRTNRWAAEVSSGQDSKLENRKC